MVKAETRKFVVEYRELLEEVASRTDSPVAPIAAAMLLSVEPEDEENESPEEETPPGSNGDSADLDEILEREVNH